MFALRMLRSRRLSFVLALACLLCAGVAVGQDAAEGQSQAATPSLLSLTKVDVTPEEPTAETLCQLSVTLSNSADRPISGLRFAVAVNGHSLPVYDKQVFLDVVPAGGEVTVPLYNFWVTETHRPLPAKGPLTVEVRVTDARWTQMTVESLDGEPLEPAKSAQQPAPGKGEPEKAEPEKTVETWTLLESLTALPEAVTATRKLRR